MSGQAVANGAATETAHDDSGAMGISDLQTALMPQRTEDQPEGDNQEDAPPVAAASEQVEPDGGSESESILERLGLGDLSEDERIELNRELGGRAAERFGELTAEKKRLQSELETLKGELGKREPFRPKSNDENPYRDKSTLSDLEEVYRAAEQTISTFEEVLEDNRDAHSSDEIYESDGNSYTKAQIRAALKNARRAIDQHIPERAQQIRSIEGYEQQRSANLQAVRQLHPWMAEEGNELRARYEQAAPALIEAVRTHMPEYLPAIDLMLADHAAASAERAQSINNPKQQAQPAETKQRKPPSNPAGSGGGSSRPSANARKRKEEAEKRFLESSGSADDLTALFLANR